ncbi:hypothetical protein [Nonomuraea africana]|uniref:PASTA domain-containing protein n=1 Tax=Nonomuraea africana TaxID=46171 RepID=A0ABR9KJE3_9ACTN|nr:hypothetical protein [Nonomuraea africana]MBE1561672.1 hypothetical protein [Nonomuraea africana]
MWMIAGIVLASSVVAPVPDVAGQGLVAAVQSLKDAGYERIRSTDVSGRGRVVVVRRDWKVCRQRPAPGAARPERPVELAVVKVEESCPARVEAPVRPGFMPALRGKSVRVARQSLPGRTTIRITDLTGQRRIVFWDTAWQVCTQSPAAGQPLIGTPVLLGVVKYGESCPA